ncbi:metallophosphoesterase [Deinococcus maricopensis DSM 21211]|uniref:Metallophosphoesterase n=1 Tax=Deinococcus maricopensis (strain DSM 21211 / LMG 22137 / NRRL B-23946 / LB-34) TaxID=709986 RepID=E8U5R9_DEIML|nr:metallophosphoesterase [Deinococcus maricopensis DSM 21211]
MAVISDVHGNAFALDAVLADLHACAPDLIVNLGDQVEGSANPAHARARQAALGATEVRGNNEEKLWLGGRRDDAARTLGVWLDTQLPPEERARLAALPLTATVAHGEVFACHGTPDTPWDSLLWAWQRAGEGGFYRARDPRELRALIEPLGARVVVCGHTHRPGSTRLGDTLLVNAGAVSDQVDGDPRARWTLLDRRAGHWTADFRAVPYDIEGAVAWSTAHSPFGTLEAHLLRTGTFDARQNLP